MLKMYRTAVGVSGVPRMKLFLTALFVVKRGS